MAGVDFTRKSMYRNLPICWARRFHEWMFTVEDMLPDFAVPESSGLQRIETERPLTREVWLVVHSDIKDVPSVRVVVDALKNALGK